MESIRSKYFIKMRGKERSKNNIKNIDNEGDNWYKMFQNCQMTDFGETLDQL